ncbi:MAG: hypothetical protein ACTHK8_18945 [Ginsengibacter sp.]
MTSKEYRNLSKSERKKVKFKDLPTANKRGAIISMFIAFIVVPFICVKAINSSPSQDVALKNLTPSQKDSIVHVDLIKKQFSEWDGSNVNLVKYVKENMNDPESFEHVETVYWDLKDKNQIKVRMTFRGKNGFGALMKQSVVAYIDYSGKILSVEN